jgi:excinuclease ABC subunit A
MAATPRPSPATSPKAKAPPQAPKASVRKPRGARPDDSGFEPVTEVDAIIVKGAAEHNLKNVDVTIPKKRLVVITGPSGSGKSSLAFDTLYAEGQRRYVESLSSYARQFLGQMDKPKYDSIRGLSPTISIEQKAASSNPRSTVGTVTEIADYMRVLWARAGRQHCHICGEPVGRFSSQQIVDDLLALPAGTKLQVLSPVLDNRKGEHRELLVTLRAAGFSRARINGEFVRLDELDSLEKRRKHSVEVVVDRLVVPGDVAEIEALRPRLSDAVETALKETVHGLISVVVEKAEGEATEKSYSTRLFHCGHAFPELSPQSFSFNSPQGSCPACHGLGTTYDMDPAKIVPDAKLAISEGAIRPLRNQAIQGGGWDYDHLMRYCDVTGIDADVPFDSLPAAAQEFVLYGSAGRAALKSAEELAATAASDADGHGGGDAGDDLLEAAGTVPKLAKKPTRAQVKARATASGFTWVSGWEGIIPMMLRRFAQTQSEGMRRYYQQYFSTRACPVCEGTRLRPESRAVKLAGESFPVVNELSIEDAHRFFGTATEGGRMNGSEAAIAEGLLKEITNRLRFLLNVGLGYLTLSRGAATLSGGESQRIRLASQVGSELTGVIYILDEPSIGLHQRDNRRLLQTLKHLRDIGNSVIVVEHDEETMEEADWLLDFGPGAGREGGRLVAAGTPAEVSAQADSITGQYLSGRKRIATPALRRPGNGLSLKVVGARENNLSGLDVEIPLGKLVAVTGVSGAGKSTLVNAILMPALANHFFHAGLEQGHADRIDGLEHLDKVIDIDQKPIGRTPRSNPATYTKLFDEIREVFALTPEAKAFGFSPSRFSFNVAEGRCEACKGDGYITVEMHFLADVLVPCEVCHGKRFNDATLRVRHKGANIHDVLEMTIAEALEHFSVHKRIVRVLQTLMDVGLGYVKLGQPAPTLSGGEAQRIKLSRELAKVATGRTLYILDEPTTGLHFDDVAKLITVMNRLVEAGNTVLVIEHNLDVIRVADWVIDLGPEGGRGGGRLMAHGTPEQVAKAPESHTGRFLAEVLRKDAGRKTKAALYEQARR